MNNELNKEIQKLLFNYISNLGYRINGLKLNRAIDIFISGKNIKTGKNKKEWLYKYALQKKGIFSNLNTNIEYKENTQSKEKLKKIIIKEAIQKNNWNILLYFCIGFKYKQFLKSDYWKLIRKIISQRDNFCCVECGNKNKLHIHHLTYAHHLNEHNYLGDLITLCEDCHKKRHN